MNLIPVNMQGSTVWMTAQEAASLEGLGLFGSKKRRKATEAKVAQATQVTQQNANVINDITNFFEQQVPALQSELNTANAELQKEVVRVGARSEKTMAFVALGAAIISTGYVVINKFFINKS